MFNVKVVCFYINTKLDRNIQSDKKLNNINDHISGHLPFVFFLKILK